MGDEQLGQWGEFLSRLRLHFFPANPNFKSKSKALSPIGRGKPRPLVERVTPNDPRSRICYRIQCLPPSSSQSPDFQSLKAVLQRSTGCGNELVTDVVAIQSGV
ncbi:hypothetical protein TNCV_3964311 [Trichonephila clavipes]|nr:hypothetical protein TNCV_3964311 [Trichonephila clavipes]